MVEVNGSFEDFDVGRRQGLRFFFFNRFSAGPDCSGAGGVICQALHCPLEVDAIEQLDKTDGVAAFIATKAVPQILVRIDREGRIAVFMKGTFSLVALAIFGKTNPSGSDQGHQIDGFLDPLDVLLLNHVYPLRLMG